VIVGMPPATSGEGDPQADDSEPPESE